MRARLAGFAIASLAASPIWASSGAGNTPPPGPAAVLFASDFPLQVDHEWGFVIGGFGGTHRGDPPKHVPVIFVHGNQVDHCDWYPVRDDFRAAGWNDQSLWALSYNGLGNNNGTAIQRLNQECLDEHQQMGADGKSHITSDDVNVPDLYDFVLAVRDYTGSRKFTIIAHSLGVTVARKMLKVHPELRQDLVAFVSIAGANHGTSFCPPGSEGQVNSCDEIAAGTQWLADLNGPDGNDETYPPAKWMTVYDGSGVGDPGYAGPVYAQSPALKGADNRQYPGTYHNDLRIDAPIVADYRKFVEAAEAATAPQGGASTSSGGAMGPGVMLWLIAMAAWRTRRLWHCSPP